VDQAFDGNWQHALLAQTTPTDGKVDAWTHNFEAGTQNATADVTVSRTGVDKLSKEV